MPERDVLVALDCTRRTSSQATQQYAPLLRPYDSPGAPPAHRVHFCPRLRRAKAPAGFYGSCGVCGVILSAFLVRANYDADTRGIVEVAMCAPGLAWLAGYAGSSYRRSLFAPITTPTRGVLSRSPCALRGLRAWSGLWAHLLRSNLWITLGITCGKLKTCSHRFGRIVDKSVVIHNLYTRYPHVIHKQRPRIPCEGT
jgi:hypothetical protein